MKITNKKHWQNGHQTRGGWFHTLNLSFYFFGIMFSWGNFANGSSKYNFKVDLFKFN